jgi:hypothetical protein
MIPAGSLRLADEPDEGASLLAELTEPQSSEAKAPPKVFVRTLLAPPGWPWEQARTAELDARLSSPLPAGDVVYQLRRLEGWRPGAPARFAAFYVMARDVDGQLETRAQVDGRDVRVVFESGDVALGRARRLGVIGLGAGVVVFAAVLVVGLAIGRRVELDGKLAAIEQQADVKLRGVSAKARLKAQDQALQARSDKGRSLVDLMADLAWVSGAKAGDAQIEGVHWDHDLLAVEAAGAKPPLVVFGDRKLQRSIKPIRPGVFLWAIERQTLRTPVAEPVAAMPISAKPLAERGGR